MALTLVEAAKLLQDDLQRGVIETATMASNVLELLPFHTVSGNAYAYVQEDALPSADFREVNNGYTESTGTFERKTEVLTIMGGDADVDRFIIQTRAGEVAEQRAEQTRMKAKAVAMLFQDKFFNGDADNAGEFDGLISRAAGDQVITPSDGLPIVGSSDADRHTFLDLIEEGLSRLNGDASAIFMNAGCLAKFRSAARRLTIYDETRDAFGRPVLTYNGIPILNAGKNIDGDDILPQDETVHLDTDCASIYIVRFGAAPGDKGVTGLTNGGVQVYDLGEVHDKPVYRTRIEFYCGLANHGDKAIVRIKGIQAA